MKVDDISREEPQKEGRIQNLHAHFSVCYHWKLKKNTNSRVKTKKCFQRSHKFRASVSVEAESETSRIQDGKICNFACTSRIVLEGLLR